jgi:hypothetical protein
LSCGGAREVDVRCIDPRVVIDILALCVDSFRQRLGRGSAIRSVVLDAEVGIDTAWIVAGGEDQTAQRAAAANHGGHGGRGENAVVSDQDSRESIRCGDAKDDLNRGTIMVAAIPADNQRRSAKIHGGIVAQGIEYRLDKILQISRLKKNASLFAQTRRAGSLVGEGCRRDLHYQGRRISFCTRQFKSSAT